MTEKLYYSDSHLHEFEAELLSCTQDKKGFAVILDKTAFFPEGGGQLSDSGFIGGVRVAEVHEKGGEVIHYCESALEPGNYNCSIDWEQRYRRMQNHSGEHIFSGFTHQLHGFDNVGFHMGAECMTMDFSGELTWEQLTQIEQLANEAVRKNLPIISSFPTENELKAMEYRSKLELTENVRIVDIPGVDRCACCAPHVSNTGEIGLIKLLDCQRHRGGVRVSLICGMDALDNVRVMQKNVTLISNLLSAKRAESAQAVERVLNEQQRLKERVASVNMELARLKAAAFENTEGNICVFDSVQDEPALREMVNMLMEKCDGFVAAFSGSDAEGYRYIIGSKNVDLRANGRAINAGIGGKGGGSKEMIQGRASAGAEDIEKFIMNNLFN